MFYIKTINLIITGGIAASKSQQLYDLLSKNYKVNVILTDNSQHFIDFKAETLFSNDIFKNKDILDPHTYGEHIKIIKNSSLNIVYPATYNFIGKIANGIADDFASLVYSVSNFKTILFPSMNENMYSNPILNKNKKILLKTNNVIWYEPKIGTLASRHIGMGRALEPEEISQIVNNYLIDLKNLENKKVLLNFGRTRSYIDKIRFISNQSSGKMGISLKKILINNCKELICCFGDTNLVLYENENNFYCPTNYEMFEKMKEYYDQSDIVICCAALNDFETKEYVDKKIEKRRLNEQNLSIQLKKSIDVLYELGKLKTNQFLVGFSLANDFNIDKAYNKLIEKNLDMIVLNLTDAMNNDNNQVKLILKDKTVINIDNTNKDLIALEILKQINKLIN